MQNLRTCIPIAPDQLNTYDVLNSDDVVFSVEALNAFIHGPAEAATGGEQVSTIADPRDILLAPVISEKSYGLIEEGTYTFLVHPDSNKTQIKIAVEKVFGVTVPASTPPTVRASASGPTSVTASARTPSARS